ncbi:MAG: hypothetical protein A2498_04240 [Lentisphaerae bacterium RIFOXYC12_FULL_60_16]|nr:MAG: hypothetical protein A2498_04240 [Lentisphaerae bacterium RIFOXYC12_FULL_60_16]
MSPFTVGESLTLEITSVVFPGIGLARHQGAVVFVPGVMAGETVTAVVRKAAARHAHATPATLTQAHPSRIIPTCPLALHPDPDGSFPSRPVCPGCAYAHMPYAEELAIKSSQFANLFDHTLHIDRNGEIPAFPAPSPLGYRNKITLHARRTGQALTLGYIGTDNSTVLDVPACPLAAEAINRTLSELRTTPGALDHLNDQAELVLRHTSFNGVLHWIKRQTLPVPTLTETTPLGPIQVPTDAFFQVNPPVAGELVDQVRRMVHEQAPERLIDAYGGIGLFGLACARDGIPSVHILESNEPSVIAARLNARTLKLAGVHAHIGTVERTLAGLLKGVAEHTTVIIDPPRTGLSAQVRASLVRLHPRHLLYVSCAPDTLARDLRDLFTGGYRFRSTRWFDMFPRTPHFETVTELEWTPSGAAPQT